MVCIYIYILIYIIHIIHISWKSWRDGSLTWKEAHEIDDHHNYFRNLL